MKIPAAKIYFPQEDIERIKKQIEGALRSGQLTLGKFGEQFEKEFAQCIGVKYAIAVNSGTSALEIPLRIFDVRDKEVMVPTNTFFATPAAVIHAGGRIRFTDINPQTMAISLESIKANMTQDVKGVIIVHIGGIISPEVKAIKKFCQESNLFLLEDAAHAHGSSLGGKMAGTFGDAAAFSFYPTKVITSGEGGMIVTDNKRIYEEASIYRDQGKAGFLGNIHTRLGYNWRMSELHAILGLSQFQRLEAFIARRNKIARIYDQGLTEIPKVEPLELTGNQRCNYYKYIALLDRSIDRTKLKKTLKNKFKVSLSGEVYELPCHLQPVFREEHKEEKFPIAEDICKRQICLPIYTTMAPEEAEYVLSSLSNVLKRF